jgi:hypothetical protein
VSCNCIKPVSVRFERRDSVRVADDSHRHAASAGALHIPEVCVYRFFCVDVSQDIPLVQGHKFVKFDDRILIVSPSSRLVVAMIPRYNLVQ